MLFNSNDKSRTLACEYNDALVVTIDGPAGAGKTTVSKVVADRLNYRYIDTGALYRAVAYEALQAAVASNDDAALETLCKGLELNFKSDPNGFRLICNGVDISDSIRTPEISMMASAVSARRPVRRYLFDIQKKFGKQKRVVLEGRDMGTVVFPEADVKFFLMASVEARALRRFKQMQGQNEQTLDQVHQDLLKRDADDSRRSLAPLKPAEDAILIDSTNFSLEEVIEYILEHVRKISGAYRASV